MEITTARAADVDALFALETEGFESDRLSRRSLAALVKSRSAVVLVAKGRTGLTGYALLLIRRGSRSARLYSIAVARAAGGRGLGTQLLRATESAAQARGMTRLRLEVRADNRRAIELYEKLGYRKHGERAAYYEDGATALLYARSLAAPAATRLRGKLPDGGNVAADRRRLSRAA